MRFGGGQSSDTRVGQALPAFYEWKIPGQSFSIQLSYDLIDRLSSDVMKGFWAVPKRGAEIGGVLLGRVVSSGPLTGGETTVFIEDYELVSCEHKRGPSYVLSESDRKRLEKGIRKGGRTSQVVGYFRSHTRPGLYLDEDDMAVIRSYFSSPSDVILLVRPYASRPCAAGFFFWEEEDIRRHSTYREFTLSREELLKPFLTAREQATESAAQAYPPSGEPEAPAAPAAEVHPAIVAAAARGRIPWRPVLYGAGLLAGLGLIEYQILNMHHPAPVVRSTEGIAALKVERNGAYLQVSWDREAPAVLRARGALLYITDGNNTQTLRMDQGHLRGGTIAYSPSGNDVSFRLELNDGQRNVSEAVRVVTAPDMGEPAAKQPPRPHQPELIPTVLPSTAPPARIAETAAPQPRTDEPGPDPVLQAVPRKAASPGKAYETQSVIARNPPPPEPPKARAPARSGRPAWWYDGL